MRTTEIEKKYNLNCHINCPFFPSNINISSDSEWYIDENNIKRRIKSIKYICNYDGHVIKDWTSTCPYNKKLNEKLNKKVEEDKNDSI